MKTLILLRHAKAEAHGAKPNDHDRVLAAKGVKAAAAMGAHIAAHGPMPDLILCSDASRARETLDALLTTLKAKPTTEIEAAFYPGRPDSMLARVRKADDRFGCVMVIGHNPGLEDLALALVHRSPADDDWDALKRMETKFPTAAMAVIRFDAESWALIDVGQGDLAGFTVPRDLIEA
jgi:phosphohistidine phosphatase